MSSSELPIQLEKLRTNLKSSQLNAANKQAENYLIETAQIMMFDTNPNANQQTSNTLEHHDKFD